MRIAPDMSQVNTRDEALAAVGTRFATWDVELGGVLRQATAVVLGARSEADRVVRRCATKVSALAAALAALGPEDDPRPLQAQLAKAEADHATARSAAAQVERVADRVQSLARRAAQVTSSQVAAARADLARRGADLQSYRAGGSGDGSTVDGTSSGGSGAGGASGSGGLAAMGLAERDPGSLDYSDNPILGDFGRGGASRADYRWAVQTWDEVVGPGVARGMTRDDFAARDQTRSAPPLRRTADVFDMFLSDPIRVSQGADGRMTVNGGRHRIEVARELGVRSLPVKVVR